MGALAAGGLAEQDAGALQAGGVELDELHVLQGDAGAVGHDDAVAGGGEGVGRDAEGAAVAAGGEHDGLGLDGLDLPAEDVVGDEALAGVVADHEVEGVPLAVDLDAALEQLLEEDGEQGVAGAVGGVDGARGGVAAEAPLGDAAVVHAGEGAAHVLELEDVLRRLATEYLGGVLVDEEVAALDGVVHVQLPRVVVGGVAERGGDAALGRAGVGAQRVDLGEDGDVDAGVLGDCERGAHAGETGPNDQDVVLEHSDLSRRTGPAAAGRTWAGAIVHRGSGAFNLPAIWGRGADRYSPA